jgi:uncharacterized protein (TIGR00251 family)
MIVKVRVIPNSNRTDIVGRLGSILRVKLATPAIEGRANKLLIRFLADFFEVKTSKVFLRRGQRGREKIIEIEGRPEEELRQVLESIP